MKTLFLPLLTGLSLMTLIGCTSVSFEDRIVNDVSSKIGTGICDSIPAGSIIKNVVVGEIVPIGETGLIDVTIEYDVELNQEIIHKSGAVLYSKIGGSYFLEALGGCEYSRKK